MPTLPFKVADFAAGQSLSGDTLVVIIENDEFRVSTVSDLALQGPPGEQGAPGEDGAPGEGGSGGSGPAENEFYNGWFDIWQRGTSFTPGSNAITADRWLCSDEGGTVTRQSFTPGQTDVPGEPKYYLRHTFTTTTTAKRSVVQQRFPDVRTFAGQQKTSAFYIKASQSCTLLYRHQQDFGASGSADVDDLTDLSVTTSWQPLDCTYTFPSISGKTINEGSFTGFAVLVPIGFSGTVEVARFELGDGAEVPICRRPVPLDELDRCQPFFWKSFRPDVTPAQNTADQLGALRDLGGSTRVRITTRFPRPMHRIPTITLYNPDAANAYIRNTDDGADQTDTFTSLISEVGFTAASGTAGSPNTSCSSKACLVHATADAEIYE